ncbi:MAG TPA: type I DNA topoisomerase [Amaricoccus sp.]|uniref:type I DNA topoisomerase n=3 Tax=Amaricoccus sp. TaxID=1872485 RepID=UPI002BF58F75|nr:type I DNA topoisomerase [Amaricoccus sp.]HMQ93521.1 type I DNA topoisomerase [Amaricoccus sp.]HMR52635.1 type I DNA topoisomerase [Amaricoccus sp.]HMT99593.1 type I DNA topoisomerase [Amaricoccus sp.]
MAVVVVESPAKAKTINKYLGPDYTVLASYGHVRDLPAKDGSVDPDRNFEMLWEVAPESQKHVRAIAEALKSDGRLILATDPDREGEAISWHLLEALTKRKAVKKDTKVERVVFNAITKNAVTTAMQAPRQIDMELVDAYLARRALDYLVGFNLSPVLWRKLPGAKSAGRVQSVALRLIVEREMEIEAFRAREYWTVKALLATPRGDEFEARLVSLDGAKLDKFDLADRAGAEAAVAAIEARDLVVRAVEAKPASRNPSAPFMTSTLQQEASRKFGFGARQTMSAAQRLYEAGHITYMRTDGIDMAPEAVMAARDAIKDRYGESYLPKSPRMYKNKAKNAQEAHECIRPTDMAQSPDRLARLEPDQRKLYDLIWKRSIASQMEAARFERTTVEIADDAGRVGLRATGQVVTFDGFLKVYFEGRDDVDLEAEGDDDRRLPRIVSGEAAAKRSVTPEQHFTQAPPRYTEATLVKRMEELGIGRPSTYASIVSTIQERDYVRKEANRLFPQDKGRLVTAFLENYFSRYLDYNFTADLESDLDRVTTGDEQWQALLARFWKDFSAALGETADLRITEVIEKINEVLEPHLFPATPEDPEPRRCKVCGNGLLSLKTSRRGGAFIGCSNYPECRYTRPLAGEVEGGDAAGPDGKLLGHDDDGLPVSLRVGPYGLYVQLGEASEETPKPKRASIPKGMDAAAVDLARALELLSLPRRIGQHPEDGETVEASIGRFGPYVRHGKTYASLKDPEEVLTIGMNRAMEVLAQKAARGGGRAAAKPIRELGEHPDGGAVGVYDGRYGPYVKWEKTNATLPDGITPEDVTLEQAVALIAARKPAKRAAPTKRAPAKTAAAKKKPAAKKSSSAGAGG